jgi:hypothetical protein
MIESFIKTDIAPYEVISSLRPGASFSVTGFDIIWKEIQIQPGAEFSLVMSNVEWKSNNVTPPSKEEYDQEYQRLKDLLDASLYQEKRRLEYPSIGDQLDALWKGGEAAEEMMARVQAVKNKYPKE